MKLKNTFIALILAFICIVSGCSASDGTAIPNNEPTQKVVETVQTTDHKEEPNQEITEKSVENNNDKSEIQTTTFNLSEVPPYSGIPYVAINNNIPYFADTDYTTTSFEKYSKLDSLGRCGVAYANIGIDLMPAEERGNIGFVKPTGWHTIKYENVDGKYCIIAVIL